MSGRWWAPKLEPTLSQGDIVQDVLFGRDPLDPFVALTKTTVKGGRTAWSDSVWTPDGQGQGYYLGRGRMSPGVVLSHSCELDKPTKNVRVLLAPALPLASVPKEADRQAIVAQKRWALMPLPDVPGLGDLYADLRNIEAFGYNTISSKTRAASMSEAGLRRLHAQVVGYFTRLDLQSG